MKAGFIMGEDKIRIGIGWKTYLVPEDVFVAYVYGLVKEKDLERYEEIE